MGDDCGWCVYILVYIVVSCFMIRRVVRDVYVAGVCEIRGPVCSTKWLLLSCVFTFVQVITNILEGLANDQYTFISVNCVFTQVFVVGTGGCVRGRMILGYFGQTENSSTALLIVLHYSKVPINKLGGS